MKKIVLLPILLLGLTLASCGSSGSAKDGEFNDLTYGTPVKEDGLEEEITYKAVKSLNSISSIELESNTETISVLRKTSTSGKGKATFFSEGGWHIEGETKETTTENSVTIKDFKDSVVADYLMKKVTVEDVDHYYLTTYSKDASGESAATAPSSKSAAEALKRDGIKDYIGSFMPDYNLFDHDFAAFQLKNEYQLVRSEVSETHTAVPWGNGYEEQVHIEKLQVVGHVDAATFNMTKISVCQETYDNRDVLTGKWLGKTQLTYRSSEVASIKREGQGTAATRLSELDNLYANSVLMAYNVSGMHANYDEGVLTPGAGLVDSEFRAIYAKRISLNSVKIGIEVNFRYNASANAFVIGGAGYVARNTSSDYLIGTSYLNVSPFGDQHYTVHTYGEGDTAVPFILLDEKAPEMHGLLELTLTSSVVKDGTDYKAKLAISDVTFVA